MSKNKGKNKTKKNIKVPARILEKVGATKNGVAFVSKPVPESAPSSGKQDLHQKAGRARLVSRPSEGEVKVISLDRIVLGRKWTEPLGLKEGNSVKIRREEDSLIISK